MVKSTSGVTELVWRSGAIHARTWARWRGANKFSYSILQDRPDDKCCLGGGLPMHEQEHLYRMAYQRIGPSAYWYCQQCMINWLSTCPMTIRARKLRTHTPNAHNMDGATLVLQGLRTTEAKCVKEQGQGSNHRIMLRSSWTVLMTISGVNDAFLIRRTISKLVAAPAATWPTQRWHTTVMSKHNMYAYIVKDHPWISIRIVASLNDVYNHT